MSSSSPTPEKSTGAVNAVAAEKSSRLRWRGVPVIHNGVFWATTPALALFGLAVL